MSRVKFSEGWGIWGNLGKVGANSSSLGQFGTPFMVFEKP